MFSLTVVFVVIRDVPLRQQRIIGRGTCRFDSLQQASQSKRNPSPTERVTALCSAAA
jgi:hypothetical protein